jgi:SAM-dependent methyltransferase
VKPPDELLERVASLTGSRPVSWQHARGGYSTAERWSLDLADGERVFAKMATNDVLAGFLRDEHHNMTLFDEDFRCQVVAFEDGEHPLLLLEDLRDARWPPPWEPGDVERVLATLERMWSMPTEGLPAPRLLERMFNGWQEISDDPAAFLGLGIASQRWLDQCLPVLVEVERDASFEGDDFIHVDIRSDNTCFAGDRVVFVDWNWAIKGSRRFDLSGWLSSLRLEGGPLPEEVAPGLGTLAAYIAGFFAKSAPLPPIETAPHVRRFQLRQLRIALPWACRELGLPRPDGDWARVEIAAAHADFESGRIDEDTLYARVEEPLTDTYLSHAEPWRQSGKSGDDMDWRWSRELTLDLAKDGDAILDVGCANGYLMESLHVWGSERGIRIEPYGVDISWRLASLARRRLPQWADNVYTGNVMNWTPPRRFDIVHTALDYMPAARRAEHVNRVLNEFLVPGGYLVMRAARMPVTPDPGEELEAAGFRPDGRIEARHPRSGEIRRTAYLRAPVP